MCAKKAPNEGSKHVENVFWKKFAIKLTINIQKLYLIRCKCNILMYNNPGYKL